MKRVLTVDDSKSMRSIIKKALQPLDVDVLQAEDGEQGLQVALNESPDLILLDMTMPVMDGPTMLKELRAKGQKTPVILLTAESGTAIIAPLVPLGFEDYVAKPFKAEELQAKVKKVLFPRGLGGPSPVAHSEKADTEGAPGDAKSPFPAESRQYCDILIVDDMENVAKHFRVMLPEAITILQALDAQTATALCRERLFRIILVDVDIPNVNPASLVRQLRALQPTATFVGLVLRNIKEPMPMVKERGLDGFLVKPFDAEQIRDFLATYFESGVFVEREENLLKINPCTGSKAREERYFKQVFKMIDENVEKIAAACYPSLIINLTHIPRTPNNVVHLVRSIAEYTSSFGIELRLITPADVRAILAGLVETAEVPMFLTEDDAKSGANRIDPKSKS
jgi:two-component system, cell cycle response regulator